MPIQKSILVPVISFSGDFLLLAFSFFLSSFITFGSVIPEVKFYYTLFLICVLLWIIIVLKYSLYEIPRIIYQDKILTKNLKGLMSFIFISAAIIYFITAFKFSRLFFGIAMMNFLVSIMIFRVLFYLGVKKRRELNKIVLKNVVLVGVNEHVEILMDKVLTKPEYEFKLAGIYTEQAVTGRMADYYKGNLNDVISSLEVSDIGEIIISLPNTHSDFINELLEYCDNNLIRVNVIPEFSEYLSQIFSIEYIENVPVMKYRKEPLQSLTNRILKRGIDFSVSLILIVGVFSWLFPIIAIIIKINSKGPVFFKQLRTGRNGNPFACLKFRSMVVNGDSDKTQATANDKRITEVGAFLRRTSIDELPQVFNVFVNNMSLVGPRPHMLKHTEEYRLLIDKFMVRHFAKPGLTGWAQILGYRGETKTVKDMENRAYADIWYIENWSLLLDLKILFKTFWILAFKKEDNAF